MRVGDVECTAAMLTWLARLHLVLVFAVLALIAEGRSEAQVSYEGCYFGSGTPIPSIPSPYVNDIARASIDPNYGPIIVYNPAILQMYGPQTPKFFYYHECAHHALGHTLGVVHPLAMEQQADCWAISNLVQSGQFGPADVQMAQSALAGFGPGDWTHLPGPQRAINLNACLGGGGL